ncbi:MAG: transcription elongation factor GreA [Pseudomonadota bacterium]|nr:transcription elongation factor GreA [Pseudomonadota bacterium]
MKKAPITKSGFERIKRELEHLKTVVVPENVRDIETARAHGDISENAEYAAAKERQAFIHGKIQELENNLATSEIIDLKRLSTDRIVFGASVTIEDVEKGGNITYQLVGPHESDIGRNKISVTSPLGKALVGKTVGDTARVKAPGGTREFEIVAIFIAAED